MSRKAVVAAACAAIATFASPATAQGVIPDVIGSTIANMQRGPRGPGTACLRGEAPAPRRARRARTGADATMQAYLAQAGASAPADVSQAYSRDGKNQGWVLSGTAGAIGAVSDPLARAVAAGAARIGDPAAFVTAGDGESAQGIWRATSADGATPLGQYRVHFRRESGQFRIILLEIFEGANAPEAISQYCQQPGDVETYLAEQELLKEIESAGKPVS